jgi:hypothetical protein
MTLEMRGLIREMHQTLDEILEVVVGVPCGACTGGFVAGTLGDIFYLECSQCGGVGRVNQDGERFSCIADEEEEESDE